MDFYGNGLSKLFFTEGGKKKPFNMYGMVFKGKKSIKNVKSF